MLPFRKLRQKLQLIYLTNLPFPWTPNLCVEHLSAQVPMGSPQSSCSKNWSPPSFCLVLVCGCQPLLWLRSSECYSPVWPRSALFLTSIPEFCKSLECDTWISVPRLGLDTCILDPGGSFHLRLLIDISCNLWNIDLTVKNRMVVQGWGGGGRGVLRLWVVHPRGRVADRELCSLPLPSVTTVSYYVLLAWEKIKVQNVKYALCWMRIASHQGKVRGVPGNLP